MTKKWSRDRCVVEVMPGARDGEDRGKNGRTGRRVSSSPSPRARPSSDACAPARAWSSPASRRHCAASSPNCPTVSSGNSATCTPPASIPSAISPSSSPYQDQPSIARSTDAITLSVLSCPLPESIRKWRVPRGPGMGTRPVVSGDGCWVMPGQRARGGSDDPAHPRNAAVKPACADSGREPARRPDAGSGLQRAVHPYGNNLWITGLRNYGIT